MSTDPRPGAATAGLRRRPLAAALVAGLALTSCSAAAGGPDAGSGEGTGAPYAAVAPEASGGGGGRTAGVASTRLDREQVEEVLLGKGEFPFTADEVVQRTGLEYFEESIGVTGDVYRRNFGEDDVCARQMDTVNERLVGEDPVDGVYREATVTDDAGSHTLHVWMLSYDRPASREAVWDEVLGACDGTTLENEHDGVSFVPMDAEPFRGLAMSIDDGAPAASPAPGAGEGADGAPTTGGTASSRVDGFSVTAALGPHVLSISGMGLSRETFEQALEVQRAALEEHPELLE